MGRLGSNANGQHIAQACFRHELRGDALSVRVQAVPNREQNVRLTENDATRREVRFRGAGARAIQFEGRGGDLGVIQQAVKLLRGGVCFEIVEVFVASEGQRALQFVAE